MIKSSIKSDLFVSEYCFQVAVLLSLVFFSIYACVWLPLHHETIHTCFNSVCKLFRYFITLSSQLNREVQGAKTILQFYVRVFVCEFVVDFRHWEFPTRLQPIFRAITCCGAYQESLDSIFYQRSQQSHYSECNSLSHNVDQFLPLVTLLIKHVTS